MDASTIGQADANDTDGVELELKRCQNEPGGTTGHRPSVIGLSEPLLPINLYPCAPAAREACAHRSLPRTLRRSLPARLFMSALGQKRTYAVQNGMSALPPKAGTCGALDYVRFGPIATFEIWQGQQQKSG